jgi:cyclic di-GMP phosphodiesterase
MDNKPLNSRKRISLDEIRIGMYVVGLDRSWMRTPFFFHRKLITHSAEIDLLRQHRIREVVIDTTRGRDIDADSGPCVANVNEEPRSGARVGAAATLARPTPAEVAFRPLAMELGTAQKIHDEALVVAQSIFDGAGGGARVNTEVAEKVVGNLAESISRSPEANLLLLQMRRFQNDLFTHAVNVCVLSLVVNAIEKFENDETGLGLGALLHDVGECRIPKNLLRKRERYSENEQRLLQQHPNLGAKLLEQSSDIAPMARRIILEHHERIDGSGYPAARQGAEISVLSQIVAIIDAYDDMLSGRSQPMLPSTEALRRLFMQSHSGSLDRALVERVIRSLGVYPVGSVVELDSGERAIVVAANRSDGLKPIVKIISSRTGAVQAHGPIVTLAESGAEQRRVVRALDPVKERIDPMAFLRLVPAAAV